MVSKRQCNAFDHGVVVEQPKEGNEEGHLGSQHVRRQQELVERSPSTYELTSDHTPRNNLLDDDALNMKYFEEKANLRKKLSMGFADESDDDQEEEEKLRDDQPYADTCTSSNVTNNSACADAGDYGQESAQDGGNYSKEVAPSSSPVIFTKDNTHQHTQEYDNEQGHKMQRSNRGKQFNNSDRMHCHTSISASLSHEDDNGRGHTMHRSHRKMHRHTSDFSDSSWNEYDNEQGHNMRRSNQGGRFDNSDRMHRHTSAISASLWHEYNDEQRQVRQTIRQERRFDNSDRIHHHTSTLSPSFLHEYDNELRRPMQRTHRKMRINDSDRTHQNTASTLSPFLSHEYDNERRHPMPRIRQESRQVDRDYSHRCSNIISSTSSEEWTWHPRKRPYSWHSITHSSECNTDKYNEEQQPRTWARDQPPHSHDWTASSTPPNRNVKGGTGRSLTRSLSACEESEPDEYHVNTSNKKKHKDRARNVSKKDARDRYKKKKKARMLAIFYDRIEALRKYKNIHGNLNIPTELTSPSGDLGIWLMYLRADLRRFEMGMTPRSVCCLDEEKVKILTELGVSEDHSPFNKLYNHKRIFYHRVQELKRFKEDNGHFNVPICGDILMPLGIWCKAVKKAASDIKEGKSRSKSDTVAILGAEMNTERLQTLADIGVIEM